MNIIRPSQYKTMASYKKYKKYKYIICMYSFLSSPSKVPQIPVGSGSLQWSGNNPALFLNSEESYHSHVSYGCFHYNGMSGYQRCYCRLTSLQLAISTRPHPVLSTTFWIGRLLLLLNSSHCNLQCLGRGAHETQKKADLIQSGKHFVYFIRLVHSN